MTTERKECSNCEGEGHVCKWGLHGHEVPVSRRRRYPDDCPLDLQLAVQPMYDCPCCNGTGQRVVFN